MIFIDTNYFLRYLLDDIPEQEKKVKTLFGKSALGKVKLCTSSVVIMEIQWVLSSLYKLDRKQISELLYNVVSLKFIQMEERDILFEAISKFSKGNLEFIDCYNLTYARTCNVEEFATFDKKLARAFAKLS